MGFAVLAADRRFRARLRMQFAVSRREFAVSRREATVPIVLIKRPRSLSHRIDDSNRDYLWTSQFSPWRRSAAVLWFERLLLLCGVAGAVGSTLLLRSRAARPSAA